MVPRVLLVGMQCEFSRVILEALLTAHIPIAAIIIPPPTHRLTALAQLHPNSNSLPLWPPDVLTVAHTAQVPIYEVQRLRAPETLARLDSLQPEVLVCACFPRRLPPEWLTRPKRGGLNVHPSLLPAYRGPQPLFWQFRNAEAHTGITVHCIDEDFDTGPIAAQAEVPLADGVREVEAERLLAHTGAHLLTHLLVQAEWPRQVQPTAGASYAPHPTAQDLVIPTHWRARHAFNFARGAEARGPLTVMVNEKPILVKCAVSFTDMGEPLEHTPPPQNLVQITFADGHVLFETA